MKTIREDIKSAHFHSSYLIFGDEPYLVNQYTDMLVDAISSKDDTMNFRRYEGSGINENELVDLAETMPFFAGHRLILLVNSGFFKSAPEKLPEYLSSVPETTVFIFQEKDVDKRGKMYKAVAKNGHAAEMKKQNDSDLSKWVLGRLKREKKKITPDALDLFFEKCGNDMYKISLELEKLVCYCGSGEGITADMVELVTSPTLENRIFQMVDALLKKDRKRAFQYYEDLVALKEPVGRMIYKIGNQYSSLLKTKEMRLNGYDTEKIASLLEISPKAAYAKSKSVSFLNLKDLREGMKKCVEAEEAFKSGRMGDHLALESLMIQLSAKEQEKAGR